MDARIDEYRAKARQLRCLADAARTDIARERSLKMAAQYDLLASRLVAREVRRRGG
jgi:hypothetical protein